MIHKINIYLCILTLIACLTIIKPTQAEPQNNAGFVYASMPGLQYASTYAKFEQVKPIKWKTVGNYPNFSHDPNYIKKPYHNPNLIREKEAQKALEEQQKAQIAKQKQQEYQKQLTYMCINSALSRSRRNYTQGGPTKITHFQVQSRTTVPQSDYRNACVDFYKQNR